MQNKQGTKQKRRRGVNTETITVERRRGSLRLFIDSWGWLCGMDDFIVVGHLKSIILNFKEVSVEVLKASVLL